MHITKHGSESPEDKDKLIRELMIENSRSTNLVDDLSELVNCKRGMIHSLHLDLMERDFDNKAMDNFLTSLGSSIEDYHEFLMEEKMGDL